MIPLFYKSDRWLVVSGQNGYDTPRLAATKPVGEDSSSQANTLPELSEGKVSGGHFSACTGEVYLKTVSGSPGTLIL